MVFAPLIGDNCSLLGEVLSWGSEQCQVVALIDVEDCLVWSILWCWDKTDPQPQHGPTHHQQQQPRGQQRVQRQPHGHLVQRVQPPRHQPKCWGGRSVLSRESLEQTESSHTRRLLDRGEQQQPIIGVLEGLSLGGNLKSVY